MLNGIEHAIDEDDSGEPTKKVDIWKKITNYYYIYFYVINTIGRSMDF